MILSYSHFLVVDTIVLYPYGWWVEGVILKPYDFSVSPKSLLLFFFFLQEQFDLGVYLDRGMDLGLITLFNT